MNTDALEILHYPDARLRQLAQPVTVFDETLRRMAERMLELMRTAEGIGLAAPQVGVPLRMFVMNVGGKPENDRVIVNPEIHDLQAWREGEEGCLSIPEVRVQVRRAGRCRLVAQTLTGEQVQQEGEGLIARVWQHETDHLDGRLIIDRMGPSDKLATRRQLRELEAAFRR